MKKILVCGGAGYIGSHVVHLLAKRGYEPIVFDNLLKGHRQAVKDFPFYWGDIRDIARLVQVIQTENCDAVMHFAALSLVGESMGLPIEYYDANVAGTITLLQAMKLAKVKHIVFSSSAAVYGNPEHIPITEHSPLNPSNPYGDSKRIMESMMHWAAQAGALNYVALRYFNAAGAHPDAIIGEDHDPESHLIPIILQTALGQRRELAVYGSDYETNDGTCIRDYIHVQDLADAHVLALDHLARSNESLSLNLGNGKGFSVLEIINTAKQVTAMHIPFSFAARRTGDPAILIAESEKARTLLGWEPRYPEIETIVEHAWQWHRQHPKGFSDT